MPSLTKPTNKVDINQLQNILKCKMHAYLAFGTMDDDEIPQDATALEALYSGVDAVFVPLGDLAKDPIEFGWKRDSEEIHAGKVRSALNIEGVIKSLSVGSDMIDLLDLSGLENDCTVMFIPFANPAAADVDSDNPAYAVIVRGVSIVDSGKGNGNKKYGEVNLEFNGQPNHIADAILMLKITDDGVA